MQSLSIKIVSHGPGNAVAVPVAKALGYALGTAFQGLAVGKDPLLTLPEGFAFMKPTLPSELA